MAEPLVVFDCVIFLQSLISEAGPSARCLELFEQGKFSIAVSRDVLFEVREVLSRSGLRKRYPLLTDERADRLIDVLLYRGKLFRQIKRRYEYPRDPYDEAYFESRDRSSSRFLGDS